MHILSRLWLKIPLFRALSWTLVCIVLGILLAGCAASPDKKDDSYGVSIHALNYSAREVAYIAVEQPGHPEGGGGGDALNPYGSGGDICCFRVPVKWSPDFKVVVVYRFYPETTYRRTLVGVPPYPKGKAGDIWLVVHPDESVEAVVSDFGPSLKEWPGSIKGYPVPSREYRIKLWKEKIEREKADKAAFEKDLKKTEISPAQRQSYQEEIVTIIKNIEYLERNKP